MMDITIYQIDPDRDHLLVMFEDFERMASRYGKEEVDASIYGKTFEGKIDADGLEDVYRIFNVEKPEDYRGRSMSISDVVAVRNPGEETKYYFCDAIGFRQIDFDESQAAEIYKAKIKVVLCEPGRMAKYVTIGTDLEDLQKIVGGFIETYYPFEEEVCIVCNDEGKFNGMRPNRAVYDDDHNIQDIIFGPFFICDCSGPNFGSLTDQQLDYYGHLFGSPEHFVRHNGKIVGIPYMPSQDLPKDR